MVERASIIILSYNNKKKLPIAIKSALEQTYQNIEIIVQDDATPNFDSRKIEELFNNMKSNIKRAVVYSNDKNLGTVQNYNSAIEKATGSVIIPLACDDVFVDADVVKDIMKEFESNINICTSKCIGAKSFEEKPSRSDVQLLIEGDNNRILERLLVGNFISGAVTSYRKTYLKKMGLFDRHYFLLEDYPMILKSVISGEKVKFLNRNTIVYCEDGVSSNGLKVKNKNKIYYSDFKYCYENEVLANLRLINNSMIKRYVMYFYYDVFTNKTIKKIKYLDIVFLKAIAKIEKKNVFDLIKK